MKAAGAILLCFVATAALAEPPAEPANAVKTSPRLSQEIRVSLPKYNPPGKVLDQPKEDGGPADPDLFALPKLTVKEKRPPSHDPDVWLTDGVVQQKAMAAYRQSMTSFEWALNSWFIPLVSAPASFRARAAYENGKFREEVLRISSLIDRLAAADPGASAGLKQELINLVEKRPPGSK